MINRREFIKTALRSIGLVAIVSIAVFLAVREETDEKCDLDFVCESCKKVDSCSLDKKNK